jgi:hypothetical protein
MTRALSFLGLLLACHCGGAPEESMAADAERVVEPEPVSELEAVTLSPSAELLDFATDWAERWSAATSRRIVIGEGGHVIEAQDEVRNDAGNRLCGGTRLSTGIRVARIQAATCPGMYETLGHELGHLLGADGHSDVGCSDKDDSGAPRCSDIMAVSSDPQPITLKALDLVCVNMTCPVKTPEL